MRRGDSFFHWRLSIFGFIVAPVGIALAVWLQSPMSTESRLVNVQRFDPSLSAQTATISRLPVEIPQHQTDYEPGSPEQFTAATAPSDSMVAPANSADFAPPRWEELATCFHENCAHCHDGNGTGNTARMIYPTIPDFTDLDWQLSKTEVAIVNKIADGAVPLMPSFRDQLSSPRMLELAVYIRTFSIGPTAPRMPGGPARSPAAPVSDAETADETLPAPTVDVAEGIRSGAVLFRKYCVGCHGRDGTGRRLRQQVPQIPDFTNSTWQQQHADPELVASILDGKGTQMPAHRGRITEIQARNVVAYLRSFGPPRMKKPDSGSDFEKSFRELEQRWNELENRREKTEPPKQEK